MATLTVLRSRVSKRLGLDETASGTEETLVTYELNDAVRDFLLRTRANVNRASITISVETDDLDTSTNILALLNISVTGTDSQQWLPERTSPTEILRMRRASSVTTGGVARFYASQGNSMLMFYPPLGVNAVVTIYYVPRPTEMSTGAHDPSNETYGGIPVEYHPALIEYAAWKMADYDDDSSSDMGLRYQAQYERLVKQAIKNIRGKGGRALGRVVVGRRGPVRTSASQDIW